MNDHDFRNLVFILSASNDVLMDWCMNVQTDDVEYAVELLAKANAMIANGTMDPDRHALLSMVYNNRAKEEQPILDMTEAKSVLEQFRLKKE